MLVEDNVARSAGLFDAIVGGKALKPLLAASGAKPAGVVVAGRVEEGRGCLAGGASPRLPSPLIKPDVPD